MALLVHIRKNGQYWSEANRWTERLAGARNFLSAAKAESFCKEMKFTGAEIFIVRDGRPPLSIPVEKRTRPD
jgi:hypothetical protein